MKPHGKNCGNGLVEYNEKNCFLISRDQMIEVNLFTIQILGKWYLETTSKQERMWQFSLLGYRFWTVSIYGTIR